MLYVFLSIILCVCMACLLLLLKLNKMLKKTTVSKQGNDKNQENVHSLDTCSSVEGVVFCKSCIKQFDSTEPFCPHCGEKR